MHIYMYKYVYTNKKRESNTEFHTNKTYSLPIIMESTILAVKYLETEVP